MTKAKSETGKRLRVGILSDARVAILEDFLNGFYGYIRPHLNWHVKQVPATIDMLEPLERWGADVIIVPAFEELLSGLAALKAQPVVILAREKVTDWPWVHMDEEAIGREAAHYLIRCGYRHLACLYTRNHYAAEYRMAGFVKEAERQGMQTILYDQKSWGMDPESFIFGTAETDAWLGDLPASTGLYTWSDGMAMWLAESCFRLGISVPGRIGLLGTDNNRNLCSAAWPNLDSVITRYGDLGVATARWIEARMAGKNPPVPQPLPPAGVMRRSSTRLQVGEDPDLWTFFDYLDKGSLKNLDIESLAVDSGCSRRTLDRRCKAALNLSLREAVELKRLETAEYLLSNTDRTVVDIADVCGFATARSLESLFKKHHNTTPAAFGRIRRGG